MSTIGPIGAGHIGSQVARLAVTHGHDVVLSNSRGPETLADLVAQLGPHARAATPSEAAAAGDIVVVQYIVSNYASEAATRLQIGSTPYVEAVSDTELIRHACGE